MRTIRKVISVLLVSLLVFSVCVPAASAAEMTDMSRPYDAHLSFDTDGKLKILQVADLQDDDDLGDTPKRLLRAAVERTQPDLIMMTGDNIAGYDCPTKEKAEAGIRAFMDIFAEYDIPVAIVFGNHDDEGTPLTKDEQIAIYETYDFFIGCRGLIAEKTVENNTLRNVGTYNIPVFDDKSSDRIVYNLWCFDSGTYNPDPAYGSYGYVLPEQVDWYVKTSLALQAANGGEPVPSAAFQHIVPPHIYRALKQVKRKRIGSVTEGGRYYVLPDGVNLLTNWLSEAPCPPNVDFADGYRQLDAMIERGDVRAVFFGHDHKNNYIVPYEGIDLVSSPGCTYQSYNDKHRGFRLIELYKKNLQTYSSSYYSAKMLLADSWLRLTVAAFFERVWTWLSNHVFTVFGC